MSFQYDKKTKTHYMDDNVAETYHKAFSSRYNLQSFRFKLVAYRERQTVLKQLLDVKHDQVLDIPAGTGKLAPIFRDLSIQVTACDISDNMLQIARNVYSDIRYKDVTFMVCDATKITDYIDEKFDVVVCLRLMHRVPFEVRVNILEQLSKVANLAIVSFGVETIFHKLRRNMRSSILGGGKDSLCYQDIESIEKEIGQYFLIENKSWIMPYLSQEVVYLLKPIS